MLKIVDMDSYFLYKYSNSKTNIAYSLLYFDKNNVNYWLDT